MRNLHFSARSGDARGTRLDHESSVFPVFGSNVERSLHITERYT